MANKPGLGRLFQVFLVASYAYYNRYVSLLQDEQYDKIAATLLKHWDSFEHPHKHLVSKEDLQAGTLYALKKYPKIVVYCAYFKIREHETKEQRREYGHEEAAIS